jgi:hypothetical protein
MYLKFTANKVSYNEALGGDLVQVWFQDELDPEIDCSGKNYSPPPPTKSAIFSANYEFPPYDITAEWCDGEEDDGGRLIKDIEMTNSSLKVVLENGFQIDITFETDETTLVNIRRFLLGTEQ